MPQNFRAQMLAGSFARRRMLRLYKRALHYLSRPGKARVTADRHDVKGSCSRHHHAMYRAGVMGMAMGDAHRGRWMNGVYTENARRAVQPLGSVYEDLRWVQNVTVT